jgi:hypothetical protein
MSTPLTSHADNIVRGSRKLHNVWLHDVAERMKHRRQVLAKQEGLDPRDVEPYPISGDVTIIGGDSGGGGLLKTGLLTAATLLTGLGLGSLPWWAPAALGLATGDRGARVAAPHSERPSEPPAVSDVPPPSQEYRVTFFLEDGTPIVVDPAADLDHRKPAP